MPKPDFFLVGAPKCGTTALYEYLRQHPDIFMPENKEPNHFCTDLTASFPYTIRDRAHYLSLFDAASGAKRIGEASVWYLYSRVAALEINRFRSDARILVMLRNPVDMMYSLHSQRVYTGNEDIVVFKEALDAERDRKRGLRLPRKVQLTEGLFYRDVASYTEQVRRYFRVFGRDKVFVIIYDDFERDTAAVYREVLRFLNVREDVSPKFQVVNANKQAKSVWVQQLLIDPPNSIRWLVKRTMPRSLRNKLRGELRRRNALIATRPPMDPEVRKCLEAQFWSEIEALSDLLGRDLMHWVM